MKHALTTLAALIALIGAAPSVLAERDIQELKRALAERLPGANLDNLAPTPIEGLYELRVGGRIVYVSDDGRYLLSGRLIDLETREDLTERVLAKERVSALADIPERKMIIFEPPGEVRHTLTTFTDIDCPYCRKMHSEMNQLNAYGIRVRYLLYPRAGIPSVSYDKAVSVWCAENQQEALTRAKRGLQPEERDCENPVREHMSIADRLGLTGTPFTITETGRVITGYMPAPALYDSLEFDRRARR